MGDFLHLSYTKLVKGNPMPDSVQDVGIYVLHIIEFHADFLADEGLSWSTRLSDKRALSYITKRNFLETIGHNRRLKLFHSKRHLLMCPQDLTVGVEVGKFASFGE